MIILNKQMYVLRVSRVGSMKQTNQQRSKKMCVCVHGKEMAEKGKDVVRGKRETEKRNTDMNYVNVMHAIHLSEREAVRL